MAPGTDGERANEVARTHTPLGWLTLLANFGYSVYGYYGFAPPPEGMPTDWWHGRTYILDFESMGAYVDDPILGALLYGLPAVVICLATFLTTRSTITRMLSLSFTLTSVLFALVGFAAAPLWVLFSWRFTAVFALMGLSLAAALLAPLLVKSWLRLPWATRFLIYFPIFFGAMAAVRGATGTSEHMTFMMSPWPIFTTLGLATGVLAVSSFLFSTALGVISLSRGTLDIAAAAGLSIAVSIPSIWVALGISELPLQSVLVSSSIAAVLIAVCSIHRGSGDRRTRLLTRGFHVGLAAVLVSVPIFSGHSLAAGDYSVNRYVRAPEVIEALQQHIKSEEFYPDTLEGLVEAGYFERTPKPRIGFDFLEHIGLADEVKYRYNEYGSSFILEFDSSYWVQCSYSGNYYFDDEEFEDEEFQGEESDWSCLDKSPTLIGESPDDPEDEYDDEDQDAEAYEED